MAAITRTNHDVVGPGKSSASRTVTFARTTADELTFVFDQLLSDKAWMGWGRSKADTASAADAKTVTFAWDKTKDLADSVSPVDAASRVVTFARSVADSGTAADAVTPNVTYVRSETESGLTAGDTVTPNVTYVRSTTESGLTANDTVTLNETAVRAGADSASANDAAVKVHAAVRAAADSGTAADAVVEYDGVERGASAADTVTASDALGTWITKTVPGAESVTTVETFNRTVTSVRAAADSIGTSDDASLELALVPRRVYLRHVTPSTAIVLQHQNWSEAAIGYNSGGTGIVHLQRGREVNLLATSMDSWSAQGLAELALNIQQGYINFHERYLCNTTRQLTSWQARNYTCANAPWITWVLFRTKAGAVADSDPNRATHGEPAVDWDNLRVRVLITGGTNPTMRIKAWFREVLPTSRGTWVAGPTENAVAHQDEFTINNQGREVYLQCFDIAGAPTSTGLYLSGT